MSTTTAYPSPGLPGRIRLAAFLATLIAVGAFGSRPARAETRLLSEAIRLSVAYEEGLPIRSRIVLPPRRHDPRERPRWSRGEKALVWSFASLNAVDAYQTMNAPATVREANPLLGSWAGDHPGPSETLAFKAASTYGMVKLAGRIEKRSTRRLALILANFVQLSVVAHNEKVTGGILF